MKKKLGYLLIIGVTILCFSGCASLNGSVPFNYQPSLLASTETINKTAGMELLIDQRPEKDEAYTKSIKDVSEKVTSKLIEDFEQSRLFENIHFSQEVGDDFIIEGVVNRFMWKMYATPISYIPLINLVIYFGVPCSESYGIAEITLIVKDARSGKILGTFKSESKVTDVYTLYNVKAGEAGAELAEAFRNVAKDLKEQIVRKIQ